MALVLKDRVKETSTTSGTGTITLAGAVTGFQSFSTVGNGNTTYYAIVDTTNGDWEVGIGVYTASGTTLSRTTVLSSSNSGSLVNFTANQKDVFVTYPSEKAVWQDSSGVVVQQSFGAITATSAALTTGTVSTTPASNTDIANKQYVDGLVTQGISYHEPVYVESPNTAGNLNATYNNGASGVGATLTNAGTQVALTVDGILMTVGKRVLIYNQTNAAQNGVYTVTTVGSGSTNWVLTRATDANTYGLRDPNSLGYNDAFFVTNGDTGAGETYVCTTTGTITFGTTNITFAQISSAQVYTAGTGLNLSPATTFNISNTGVTAATYGSASAVPVFAVNAQGQITGVTDTNIAISGSAVSGNISGSAGSVANALTAGSFLTSTGTFDGSVARTFAVDAVSTNTASKVVARDSSGDFAAGTITASLSGNATTATTATNVAGGAANQIPYNTAAGTTAFIAAPTTSGTYLNWNGSAFTYSAISLGTVTSVAATVPSFLSISGSPITTSGTLAFGLSGTALPTTSGGTGLTSFTANGVVYASSTSALATGSALTFDGTRFTIVGGNANSLRVDNGGQRYTEIDIANGGTVKSSIYWDNTNTNLFYSSTGSATYASGASSYHSWNISSEQMRLTSTGLGIGTSSPAKQLDLAANNTGITTGDPLNTLRFTDTDTTSAAGQPMGRIEWYSSDADTAGVKAYIQTQSTDGSPDADMVFATNHVSGGGTAEKMRIQYDGNVGIGTSSPGYKLTVAGAGGSAVVSLLETGVRSWGIRAGGAATNTFDIADFTAGVTRLTIDSSGNLGLGVTPSAWTSGYKVLQVSDRGAHFAANTTSYSSAPYLFIGNNGYGNSGAGFAYTLSQPSAQYRQVNAEHQWLNAPSGTAGNAISFTQALTLTADGDLCVGTTAKVYEGKVSVSFDGNAGSGDQGIALIDTNASLNGDYALFVNSSGNVAGRITHNGTTTVAYTTSSDYRLKNIIGPITNSGAYIDSLNPVEGTWKSDGATFVGLIAHEVQESSRTPIATGIKDGDEMQSMDYSNSELIANLIAEVKSLRKRLADAGIA